MIHHKIGILAVSKSDMYRIVGHETGYSIQVHMPKGWRDCISSPYCVTLDQAKAELVKKETEYFKSL